ncbi:Ig-like domain-containing protein [Massilia glaciei]|uniref:Ig-like domain-containing protein n=1 Tax=Massilia glaciei TaxID=1524097 RepID=UPI0015E82597|nr:Ig-like domain-containing protein [Massilia glaciei]
MQTTSFKRLPRLAILLAAFTASNIGFASEADHREFEASLHAPYKASAGTSAAQREARVFTLAFDYPYVKTAQDVSWRLEVVSPNGAVVRRWHGAERLFAKPVDVKLAWDGRVDNVALPAGIYQVRMVALSKEAAGAARADASEGAVEKALGATGADLIEQTWEISVGATPSAKLPKFTPMKQGGKQAAGGGTIGTMAAPATASLPYTVILGNLHSQTNHSDGGDAVAGCSSGHAPQSGEFGPSDAFIYAKNRGLDLLVTSEHNHMYDGSSSTNTAASPAAAQALFQSGLTAASDFNTANPDFLAVYGLEWGVINNGGHLNIFNSTELLQWEYNASGQLIGDTFTDKTDYAALYSTMRQRGYVGQFNHPASTGQYLVNGIPLGYTADGDQAMVLCEVLNTSAFSANTTETETGRSTYESGCKKALEAGFHVAFSTNQDNHCANWGASYTNRTGVLIPSGTALSATSFVDALKARRVFATMDKNSQLVLTANGHIMGSRITNSGPLNLLANFASTTGQTVATVVIYEGVPGRNGTVTQLSATADTTITPAIGEHFYYAKLTQGDGKILWSAPIWVTQTADTGGDTTAPAVTAAASGTAGTITLSANASDAVGVARVDFYVDNVLQGTDAGAPYAVTLDSTTLANGSHSLVARAFDAAGNVGVSTTQTFSVSNPTADTTAPAVTASQSGTSGTITLSATASDAVGVSKVEFYVDNVLKATDSAAPYSATLDSTTLGNGSHSLVARAYDAAGNIGVSAAQTFSISNPVADTTAPTVTASQSVSSGTQTFAATASDNVGVSKVEFYVDNVLKGTDTAAPYSMTLLSSTLSSGTHALTAKAFDAAGNSKLSTAVSFSVGTASQLILNGGFESGSASWSATSGVITNDASQPARTGSYKAWLNGYGASHTDTAYQQIAIPSGATSVNLSFWLKVSSAETTTTSAYDTLKVQVRSSSGAVLATLATYSNLNKGTTFVQKSFSLNAYKGQTVRVYFLGVEGSTVATSFIIDDVSVLSQ